MTKGVSDSKVKNQSIMQRLDGQKVEVEVLTMQQQQEQTYHHSRRASAPALLVSSSDYALPPNPLLLHPAAMSQSDRKTHDASPRISWRPAILSAMAFTTLTLCPLYLHSHHTTVITPSTTQSAKTTRRRRRLGKAKKNQCSTWHVSTNPEQFDTCTNSPDYPLDWNRDDLKKSMLFDTKQSCCRALEGMIQMRCRIEDVCDPDYVDWEVVVRGDGDSSSDSTDITGGLTDQNPTAAVFYPIPESNICLSDGWHDQISSQFHFATPEECCSSGWLNYKTCLSRTVQMLYQNVPTTPQPSFSPNTDFPTWSPTLYDCYHVHDTWHMSTIKLFTCTNDGLYPREWTVQPEMHLFGSQEECCLAKFPGMVCSTLDVCKTKMPTASPTRRPTREPTASPTKDPSSTLSPTEAPATFTRGECNGNSWHMSRSRDNTCSNDDDYPETWNHETLSGYFLSDSPEGCCEMNYFGRPGKECIINDVCFAPEPTEHPTISPKPTPRPSPLPTHAAVLGPTTTRPTNRPVTSPPTAKIDADATTTTTTTTTTTASTVVVDDCDGVHEHWHPVTEPGPKSCSNGLDDYPTAWDNLPDQQLQTIFYDSPEECCQKYWNGPCEHTNYCVGSSGGGSEPDTTDTITTTSTTLTTSVSSACAEASDYWHPTIEEGPKTCSNGKDDYPSGWDELPPSQLGTVFFNTVEECCQGYYNEECVHKDICASTEGSGNEANPTSKPVNDDSTSGSESTEPKPTNMPTPGSESVTTTTSTSTSFQQTNCEAHEFWHPVTNPGPKSCSNGLDDYPKAWDGLPATNKEFVFYDNPDKCCQEYWKEDCVQTNICPVAAPIPTNKPTDNPVNDSAGGDDGETHTELQNSCRLWHPVLDVAKPTCSNGRQNYPKSWDDLPVELKGEKFYGSAVDCCVMYWLGSCDHVYDCEEEDEPYTSTTTTTTSTSSVIDWDTSGCGRWHVTGKEGECSNGKDDYNKIWDNLPDIQKDALFFDEASDCCDAYWGGSCSNIADQCAPPGPTQHPTNKPIIVSNGEIAISLGTDNFDDPSSSFPWNTGDPPQWAIETDTMTGEKTMVSEKVIVGDPIHDKSILSLKTTFTFKTRFKCDAKVDTMMPFDWFSLRVNGSVKYPYYSSSGGKWISFGTKIDPGDNLIELVVEAAGAKPSFSRYSGLGYGSGYVWLDNCLIEKA